MAIEEVHDIVIVGGGICGLALSLALHRKGMKSLVLERSKVLRSEGAGIGVHHNGWQALDKLGIGNELRNYCLPLKDGMRHEDLNKGRTTVKSYGKGLELRCLKRKHLIETLAKHVPAEQIRFGCEVVSFEFDHRTNLHILTTRDGGIIKAKVLVGCDGFYSVIAKSLNVAPPKFYPLWVTRGVATYPEGHHFSYSFYRIFHDREVFGRVPIDDKSYLFNVSHYAPPPGDTSDPEVIKEYALETLKGLPDEIVDSVHKCDMDTLTIRHISYRPPWSLIHQNFRKGTMTIAGDAMHGMGPFIGQGGSSAIEDAIVLTRCLSNVMKAPADSSDEKWVKRVEDALDLYIKERRPRIVRLTMQAYLVGTLVYTKSWLVKLVCIFLLKVLFGGNNLDHVMFDCGPL